MCAARRCGRTDMNETPSESALRRKRDAGQELSEDEREALRGHWRKYTARRFTLHASESILKRWRDQAAAVGLLISPWIVEQIERGQCQSDDETASLREALERARAEELRAKDDFQRLWGEKRELEERLHRIEERLMQRLDDLEGGP